MLVFPKMTGGNVVGPDSATDAHIPQFDGTSGKRIKDGLPLVTTLGSPGADTNVPSEKAVRAAIATGRGENHVTDPDCEINLPTIHGHTWMAIIAHPTLMRSPLAYQQNRNTEAQRAPNGSGKARPRVCGMSDGGAIPPTWS